MTPFVSQFKAAVKAGTPIVSVRTPDQAATVTQLVAALRNGSTPPIIQWDAIRGVQWLNAEGASMCWSVLLQKGDADFPKKEEQIANARRDLSMQTSKMDQPEQGLVITLDAAQSLPEEVILFVINAQMFWDHPGIKQAIWNLRDTNKANGRVLALLTSIDATPPAEIRDAVPLSEELPTLEDLQKIVEAEIAGVHEFTKLPVKADVTAAVDAVCGLPAFPAEQAVAMSFGKTADGKAVALDVAALWGRKRAAIEQTQGLKVYMGDDTFADLGGLANIKEFLLSILHGEEPPRVIVFMDEINYLFGLVTWLYAGIAENPTVRRE